MNVTRADLIQQLREKHSYTKKAATRLVDDFVELIIENMEEGNTVSLRNLGSFDIIERAERRCPSVQTHETIVIPAHYIPKFYPAERLKKAVRIWADNEKRGI